MAWTDAAGHLITGMAAAACFMPGMIIAERDLTPDMQEELGKAGYDCVWPEWSGGIDLILLRGRGLRVTARVTL